MTEDRVPSVESPRFSLLGALEGHYLAMVLDGLHREGVLGLLSEPVSVDVLAMDRGLDREILRHLLGYVAASSEVIEDLGDGRFVLRSDESGAPLAPLLDLYVGAFDPCLRQLGRVLADPAQGNGLVDWERHAAAFARAGTGAPEWLVGLVESLSVESLLDLGCGGGALLRDLARRNPAFVGIGIDANPNVVKRATGLADEEGVGGRLSFVCGEVLDAASDLTIEQRGNVNLLVASSLLNAWFGSRSIDVLLSGLHELFAGKILVVSDYYGQLGHPPRAELEFTMLHDLAQVVSGQGVPPPDVESWRALYSRNGATLVQATRSSNGGFERFMHLVQL